MIVIPGKIGAAALIVILMAAPGFARARAETRVTSFATFMHIGPGRQFAVSDELPIRTTVDVAGCEKNWCQIRYGDAMGWIDQRMLASAAPPVAAGIAASGNCVDFARTGWPNAGDHEHVCLPRAGAAAPNPR